MPLRTLSTFARADISTEHKVDPGWPGLRHSGDVIAGKLPLSSSAAFTPPGQPVSGPALHPQSNLTIQDYRVGWGKERCCSVWWTFCPWHPAATWTRQVSGEVGKVCEVGCVHDGRNIYIYTDTHISTLEHTHVKKSIFERREITTK